MSFLLRLWMYGLVALASAPAQAQGTLESPRASTQHFELARSDSQERGPQSPRVSCEGWNTSHAQREDRRVDAAMPGRWREPECTG